MGNMNKVMVEKKLERGDFDKLRQSLEEERFWLKKTENLFGPW